MPADSPSSAPPTGSEADTDPAAFLQAVRELSEKRDREDAERFRKLEEEVEKGRRERAARRAERTRSISPEKLVTPTTTAADRPLSRPVANVPVLNPRASSTPSPTPSRQVRADGPTAHAPATMTTPAGEKRGSAAAGDVPEFQGFASIKRASTTPVASPAATPVKNTDREQSVASNASTLARGGTLPWQQRPRPGGSRPMSMVGKDRTSHAMGPSNPEQDPTRNLIKAVLGAQDPSWFRQTADRGTGSPAYRQDRDESTPRDNGSQARRELPGLSRESSVEPESVSSPPISGQTTQPSSARESFISTPTRISSSSSTAPKPDLKSLIAADEGQQRASPAFENENATSGDRSSATRSLAMSSSQARLTWGADRSSSPTKGVGGFVQSAMLKRSDSVSKRSSSSSPTRQNSVLSPRGRYDMLTTTRETPRLDPPSQELATKEDPSAKDPEALSQESTARQVATTTPSDKDIFAKPYVPHHSRSKSVASTFSNSEEPGSPSKRWSPTKSSWIESALSKPESPKPMPLKNTQPSWMANLAKANAKRASADVTPESETRNLQAALSRAELPAKSTAFVSATTKANDTRDMQMKSDQALDVRFGSVLNSKSPVSQVSSTVDKEDAALELGRMATPTTNADSPRTKEKPAIPMKPSLEPSLFDAQKSTPLPPTKSSSQQAPAPNPASDLRGNLKPRAPPPSKPRDEPEFLAKFGNLRKTQQEKYVAPDLLRDNILRGKSGLTITGGPVKTPRKDELKESLLAKKEEIKKAKEEGRDLPGQLHERKASESASKPPAKPEALAKRDLLGRADSARTAPAASPPKEAVPEALMRQKSLRKKPILESTETVEPSSQSFISQSPALSKQVSAPAAIETAAIPEKSKLAARFNPGLAGLLARGPPGSSASRPGGSALDGSTRQQQIHESGSDAISSSETLQDVRKDRAKGPKRRKAGVKGDTTATASPRSNAEASSSSPVVSASKNFSTPFRGVADKELSGEQSSGSPLPTPKTKPQAIPGSAASLMVASLGVSPANLTSSNDPVRTEAKTPTKANFSKPIASARGSTPTTPKDTAQFESVKNPSDGVPEFKGFGSARSGRAVKAPADSQTPPDNILPRSSSLARQPEMRGLGISMEKSAAKSSAPAPSPLLPPKPVKPSRTVSGQLAEASPKPGLTTLSQRRPLTEAGRLLARMFDSEIRSQDTLTIDTQTVLARADKFGAEDRVLRTTIDTVHSDGTTKPVPKREEYTLFDEGVYLFTCTMMSTKEIMTMHIFVWAGSRARETTNDAAQTLAHKLARTNGPATVHAIRQGEESALFLHALGGILITRRGARDRARKQYMLCGRKHLGHIAFDEVDFGVNSLSAGFVFLISYHASHHDAKLYLWKGSACSTEEVSAARLAAMDMSETGGIEVDHGAEFANFINIFGPRTNKGSFPKMNDLWKYKAVAPHKFVVRLFRIQQIGGRTSGIITALWNRRPSWGSVSPSSTGPVKATAERLESIVQSSLEPEGIYVLDGSHRLYILVGPLFSSLQPTATRDALFAQTLLFASDYGILAASMEDRHSIPKCSITFSGVPSDVKVLFRQWDEGMGLWGTAGLMAGLGKGSPGGKEVKIALEEMMAEIFRTS